MIDIRIINKNGKEIGNCGCELSEEKEREIYIALRNSLLKYSKLIEIFGK